MSDVKPRGRSRSAKGRQPASDAWITNEQPASAGYNVKIASQEVIGMDTAKTATRNGRTLVNRLLPVVLPISVSAGLILGSRPSIEDLTGDLEAGGADGWRPWPPQIRRGRTAVTATLS